MSPRIASGRDGEALGRCIGRAFAHDPVSRWSFGEPAVIEAVYGLLARRVYVPRGHSTRVDGGGALWLAPGQARGLGLGTVAALGALLLHRSGVRHAWRADQVDRAMRARRPRRPHFYLFAIGVAPEARGRGLGASLLRFTLEQADARGQGTYLENTNPANFPLYERFGFVAGAPFSPEHGCPPLWPMWRAPRACAGGRTAVGA